MAEDTPRSISRRDLSAVVRRASELADQSADPDEQLSEEEVVRIAAELGLEPRHVKQALFEGAREEDEAGFLDKQFGPPRIIASRAVPLDATAARRAIEDYLITCEYLRVLRRMDHQTTFEPAWDAVSKIARSFRRSSDHLLAQAVLVETSVRQLEPGWSHVRVRAVFKDERRSKVVGVAVGGGILSLPAGGFVAAITAGIANGLLVPEAAAAMAGITGIATAGAVISGYFVAVRNRYRRWRDRTQLESEAILDRLERGDDLRPPPAPWVQKLKMKFGI